MKIYLDDKRPAPEGWILVRWPVEAIEYLKTSEVTELDLDHDLGEEGPSARTGYDVLLWLEEKVATTDFVPPAIIKIHSANNSVRAKMELAIKSIHRFINERKSKKQDIL